MSSWTRDRLVPCLACATTDDLEYEVDVFSEDIKVICEGCGFEGDDEDSFSAACISWDKAATKVIEQTANSCPFTMMDGKPCSTESHTPLDLGELSTLLENHQEKLSALSETVPNIEPLPRITIDVFRKILWIGVTEYTIHEGLEEVLQTIEKVGGVA